MFRPLSPLRLLVALLLLALGGGSAFAAAIWSDVSPSAIASTHDRPTVPERFRALSADLDALRAQLAAVPHEDVVEPDQAAVIELPMPYGGFERFAILETALLAPELGAQFPEIRTYTGRGIDDLAATVRLDITPAGFHGMILAPQGTVYIDPFQRWDDRHYQSYYTRDHVAEKSLGGCTVIDEDGIGDELRRLIGEGAGDRSGTQRRTYRAAVAATGEYTAYHGGTVALGLAAVTTSMNRVTGVYEKEVAVRMQLIANNSTIIYTNASTDPYTNNNGSTMLSQNQTNLDAVIGTANYDIGHVFSTGGGGIAGLGVVCRAGQKARGVTGLNAPIGDNFDIDYVAHEIGHQFGSNHSFNGSAGSCAGGNRNAATAYEPGSGSTIMAYAGICPPQNLQAHSDDYFIWISIQEIVAYTTTSFGNGCPTVAGTGVIEPVVDAGTGGFAIPISTPFALTATATTTGAATYCWEESDLGPAGHPNTPSGNAPIFRSFDPVASPTRTFPKLSDLLNNTQTLGEILPSYARSLSFKVTVRDTQAGGVGVIFDGIAFTVAASGPFLVTAPNTAVTWNGGSQYSVTWNVASTDAAPVSCSAVNILLSTDGGNTWPTVLATSTPNDGTELVTAPNIATNLARVKVQAAANVFFDISNVNFAIQSATGVADAPFGLHPQLMANRPNPFGGETTLSFVMPSAGRAELSVYDLAGRRVRTLVTGEVGSGHNQVTWDGSDASGRPLSAGVYFYRLETLGESLTGRMTLLR